MLATQDEELYNLLLLREKNNIGDKTIRLLLQHFGSATEVIKASEKKLKSIEGVGALKAQAIKQSTDDKKVKEELSFIHKHNIQYHFINSSTYPKNLRRIDDAPSIIFTKGNTQLDHGRTVAIVGTRQNTEQGRVICEQIVEGLAPYSVQILSGMAYGIDIISHKAALSLQMPTIAVLAHGLDRIYPAVHRSTARDMLVQGGLLTEYPSNTKPDKQNFPMRNRIVAGLCDALLVIETDVEGGSMITAKLASGYNKDVMAVPGRISDKKSAGCNYLIKTHIAHLVEHAEDIADIMGWQPVGDNGKATQQKLFLDLTEDEAKVLQLIEEKELIHIDELSIKTGMNSSTLASVLLHLELHNAIKSISGKRYAKL